MSNYEKISSSPEALGNFLSSLTTINSPWGNSFRKEFCASCGLENCYSCPHKAERDNPAWWLKLETGMEKTAHTTIKIQSDFSIEWGREYYIISAEEKKQYAPCICCNETGKVTIKGTQYLCPRCDGNWQTRETVGTYNTYSITKWKLKSIYATSQTDMTFAFKQIGGLDNDCFNLKLRATDLNRLIRESHMGIVGFYDDYSVAMAEVSRLNAEEQEKQKGAGADG